MDHGSTGKICIARATRSRMRLIVSAQGSSPVRTHPTIKRSMRRCTVSRLSTCTPVRAQAASPNKTQGETTAANKRSRDRRQIFLSVSASLCWLNFAHAHLILCATSTLFRLLKSPGIFLQRYLCDTCPSSTSTSSPATSIIVGPWLDVVKIFDFFEFKCKPMASSSWTRASNIRTSSCQEVA